VKKREANKGSMQRARQINDELVPLLRHLFPDKTQEEWGSLISFFALAHGNQPLDTLDQPHIDELTRTLRYWIGVSNLELGIGSPGLRDECQGCHEFKLTMLEMETGVTPEMLADPQLLSEHNAKMTDFLRGEL
jgi:hypothetical protein